MKQDEIENIIEELKTQYSRDLRKQLVKTILAHEKTEDQTAIKQSYNLMNQIFSYVLKSCNWSISENSKNWDNSPLEIMETVFPKLETTQWYKEQALTTRKEIDVKMDQNQ